MHASRHTAIMSTAYAATSPISFGVSAPLAARTNTATSTLPAITPSATCANGRRKTAATMRRLSAPSATRTPISRLRRETVNASTA